MLLTTDELSPSRILNRIQCGHCIEKQRRIDQLTEEVGRLKSEISHLKYQQKKIQEEGIFGSNTPSSQKPFKKKSPEPKRHAKGGGQNGHKGHGRQKMSEETADRVIELKLPEACPTCGGVLEGHGIRERSVIDLVRPEVERILYSCARGLCQRCRKVHATTPVVLPRALLGNELIAQGIGLHYLQGMSIGKCLEFFGNALNESTLIKTFHRVARLLEPALTGLMIDYRKSLVKHADETGWRTDGDGGYAWIFCTKEICLFEFQDTRSARVAHKVLGGESLPGVLVVDRYPGYNQVPCLIQYCYAHLLRDIEKLRDEFESDKEVLGYTEGMATLLASAMNLRGLPIADKQYYTQAKELKSGIEDWTSRKCLHSGIHALQKLFREKTDRLFHWVTDRRIPCENNYAERQIRKAVLARKVSFGSQSANGAKTRGILMSYLFTAACRVNPEEVIVWFKDCLDQIVKNPKADPYTLLPKTSGIGPPTIQ